MSANSDREDVLDEAFEQNSERHTEASFVEEKVEKLLPTEDMFFGRASYQNLKSFTNGMIETCQNIKQRANVLESRVEELRVQMTRLAHVRWTPGSLNFVKWLDSNVAGHKHPQQ